MAHMPMGAQARRPNPALPGTALPGTTCIEWTEGGAFLLMRSQTDHKDLPDGIALFGSDKVLGTITLCCFDERGVSRLCPVVSSGARSVSWHHDDPAFMQRLTASAEPGGSRMTSKGEMAKDGEPWTDDLPQVSVRKKSPLPCRPPLRSKCYPGRG